MCTYLICVYEDIYSYMNAYGKKETYVRMGFQNVTRSCKVGQSHIRMYTCILEQTQIQNVYLRVTPPLRTAKSSGVRSAQVSRRQVPQRAAMRDTEVTCVLFHR